MACCTRIERYVEAERQYWTSRIEESFRVAQRPYFLEKWGLSSPAPHEAGWQDWTHVAQLSVEECRTAAERARQDVLWTDVKAGVLVFGGILTSALAYTAMLVTAGAIVFLTGNILAEILASCIEMFDTNAVSLLAVTFTGVVAFECAIFWVIAQAICVTLYIAPRLWTKELAPAIGRVNDYAAHLRQGVELLEAEILRRGG